MAFARKRQEDGIFEDARNRAIDYKTTSVEEESLKDPYRDAAENPPRRRPSTT